MTTAKEKPILFSTPMVQAILCGEKTQTRRVMNPQPVQPASPEKWSTFTRFNPVGENGPFWCWAFDEGHGPVRQIETDEHPYHFPKYRVGDVLWVRETFRLVRDCDMPDMYNIHGGGSIETNEGGWEVQYENTPGYAKFGSKSPLFMPRWAARIFLRVTDVRAERVQDITEEDARAEGADTDAHIMCLNLPGSYRNGFRILWDSLHHKAPDHQWEANPWVWAYTFERIESATIDGKDKSK